MNILFVCSRNKWRSPTAENIFKNRNGLQVKSAGTASSATIKINAKLLEWADIVFAMEKNHKEIILKKFPDESIHKQIIVLNIADEYQFMDPQLIEEINAGVAGFINTF